ncbi:MAG: hypothetical protein MUE63_06680 [Xanthomonadales bacterium]|nr:hypothetical protein [Xanthomonadales bacterium]
MSRKSSAAPTAALLAAALLLSACAADTIEDRRFGQQVVCHDGKTLTVSNADSFVHLDPATRPGPAPETERGPGVL